MLMIGFSTEQNTTNLIPAIQIKGISKYLLIETSVANTKGWSNGFFNVLKGRKIDHEALVLAASEDSDIEVIISKIQQKVVEYKNQKIYWNIGGGQKIHNLALFLACIRLKNEHDTICYANPGRKPTLELLEYKNNRFNKITESINVDLSAKEVFMAYGIEKKAGRLIYSRLGEKYERIRCLDLMSNKHFRKYMFELSSSNSFSEEEIISQEKIKNIFRQNNESIKAALGQIFSNYSGKELTSHLLDGLKGELFGSNKKNGLFFNSITPSKDCTIEIKDECLKKIIRKYANVQELTTATNIFELINENDPRISNYIEKVLSERIQEMLENSETCIVEAYANLKTMIPNVKELAEYDIILVTQWATIIALDAKSFDIDDKDIEARLYNLEKSAGKFVKFNIVLPYDPEDINEQYFPQKLRNLPFKCNELGIPFYTFSDSLEIGTGYLSVLEDNKLSIDAKPNKNSIEIHKVEGFLKNAGLL